MSYSTVNEFFWSGEKGDEYFERNQGDELAASNLALFASVLHSLHKPASVIEFGAGDGLNLAALHQLLPGARLSGLEINTRAVERLKQLDFVEVEHQSVLDFESVKRYDMVLTKGFLIHFDEFLLPKVYDILHRSCSRYICLAEYYSPRPVSIRYRDTDGILFKRDFAGEMLDRFSDLRLVNYGFTYRRDSTFRHDDINWFVLERTGS